MKHSDAPASLLSCLATAACLLIPLESATAAEPYRMETHGPRIGSRILLFVKDIAFGDNPNDRYRHLPANQRRQQQNGPAITPPGQRFSLDEPPIVNSRPPERRPLPPQQPQMAAQNPPPRGDMPYVAQDTTPAKRGPTQAGVGGQKESVPPVRIKPKPVPSPAPEPKPAVASKTPVEDPAPQQKPRLPEPTASQSLTASNNAAAAKKSWQAYTGDTPAVTNPASSPPPPAENNPPLQPPAGGSGTLTGSKTNTEGRVKSPYPPFNELDVTGLPTGSLAMDPTTGKVFRVP